MALADVMDKLNQEQGSKEKIVPCRDWKKRAQVYVPDWAKAELKIIGVEANSTEQDLMIEAINLLFKSHGREKLIEY